jgi:hypothetical protein
MAPAHSTTRAPTRGNFGAQSHGFSTGCLRFARWVTRSGRKTRFWLPGQALPGGIGYPQGSCERFPISFLHPFLLSQACLARV